ATNSRLSQNSPAKTIHYAWIGPPTYKNEQMVPGHDLDGPIQLAQKLQNQPSGQVNPIKFWCLKKYQDFYRKQFFKAKVEIEVCGVEDLIEQELKGNMIEAAQQFKAYMDTMNFPNFDTPGERVEFKDGFSLFLLLIQAGYFLDTNVLPLQNHPKYEFEGERQFTGPHGPSSQARDFYLMYSPVPNDMTALKIYNQWMDNPALGNVGVFDGLNIPRFTGESHGHYSKLGVVKTSYKSYSNLKNKHFYWLAPDRINFFSQKRAFTDNNLQCQSSTAFLLESCSLHYAVTEDKNCLLSLPIKTDTAYVAFMRRKIFFVRMKEKEVVCIEHNTRSTLYDAFPKDTNSKPVTDPELITRFLAGFIKINKMYAEKKLVYPRHLVNEKNATYLHEAVILQQQDIVQTLRADGARTDLRATYRILPDNKCIEVTAEELAHYLNFTAIEEMFASHSAEIKPS
ncbi:MAG: hypothetical protein J0I93_13530, partial [Legionella sp.]|nr:hypothetical protein [Legionella sp.]